MTAPRALLASDLHGRLGGTPLVVMLDVDGTLAPIAPRPEDAVVPDATRRVVADLVALPGVHVALVSGRAAADALRMVDVDGLWVVGNHGAEVLAPDGRLTVDELVVPHEAAVAEAARALEETLRGVAGVAVENKRWSLSVHYRRAEANAIPMVRAAAEATAARTGLRLGLGKEVVELRAPAQVHKGTAIVSLARRLGAERSNASALFVGDDVTDEDGFTLLRAHTPEAITIRVTDAAAIAPVATAAEFTVRDPDAVRQVLEAIVEARSMVTR
jgi:trehalose 6-phosphate phosphatase